MVFVTAQLFARPSISPDSMISLRSIHSKDQMIEGWLGDEADSVLGTDILVNWDTTQDDDFDILPLDIGLEDDEAPALGTEDDQDSVARAIYN